MSLFDEMFSEQNENVSDSKSLNLEIASGIVTSNYDADNPGCVKVVWPHKDDKGNESHWLPVASSYAGEGYGVYFQPEVDDEVLVAYPNGNPYSGTVICSIWSAKRARPERAVDENNYIKKIITKAGHQIFFDDTENAGGITIKTTKELQITLLDEKEVISIQDSSGDNVITIDSQNGKIEIKAKSEISIDGGSDAPINIKGKEVTVNATDITVEADSALNLKGQNVKIEGQSVKIEGQDVQAKGNSGVKIESSAMLTLKGSMTKIN